jgi:hypothetical protein
MHGFWSKLFKRSSGPHYEEREELRVDDVLMLVDDVW